MTPRQSEISAEAFTASLLARAGFDISVQYGANQPHYDLVAEREGKVLLVSVKGNQDGGWPLAVSQKEKGVSYHQAVDKWRARQRNDIIFFLVQFMGIGIDVAPRVYVATPDEIAEHMKTQRNGQGHGCLDEDYGRDHPRSQYQHRVPDQWRFSKDLIDGIVNSNHSLEPTASDSIEGA